MSHESSGKPDRSTYLRQLLSQRLDLDASLLEHPAAGWWQTLRHQAVARVQTLALPSQRDEEWRFTDLSSLMQVDFQAADQVNRAIAPEDLEDFTLPEAATSRLVFINGLYAPHLSAIAGLPEGVVVGSLADPTLLTQLSPRISHYLAQASGSDEVFTALNTAGLADAALLWIPRNLVLESPIHVLFLVTAPETPIICQPRCLVIAESNSAVTLVEDYATVGEDVYFTNTVTEIWAEENAEVCHVRLQREGLQAFHVGKTAVTQARSSRYACHAITLGGALSRHNLDVFHTGEQVETTLNGLTMIADEQVADSHSAIAYTKPYSTSRQLHKCIIDDKAHAIFNGKVSVPQAAQLTDAAQLNRNLLLSPKARVDTKPQLEIVADNVKCTHGATVSQLDADEVFYFQSRGIDAAMAHSLLIYAFAFEIIDQLPVTSVKDRLAKVVSEHTR